jgi:hypothetical protein
MSDTKFTAGPWFAVEQKNQFGHSLGWLIEHRNGRIGWSSYGTYEPNVPEERPYPIARANAHLMAAAPDLYAVLAEFLAEEDRQGWESALIDRARLALAKAREGQP